MVIEVKNNMNNFIAKIVEKIKSFLNKIFSNKTAMLNEGQNHNINNIQKKSNIVEEIKKENKKNQTVQDIIDITESNPYLLENLSMEQLDVIDNYYIDENQKLENEIKTMNKKIDVIKNKLEDCDKILNNYNAEAV